MKLADVKAAPGPVESARAMSGLQCSKLSLPTLKQLRCGAGRILSVLTVPCRQLSTSWASPFIGNSHICDGVDERVRPRKDYLLIGKS